MKKDKREKQTTQKGNVSNEPFRNTGSGTRSQGQGTTGGAMRGEGGQPSSGRETGGRSVNDPTRGRSGK